MLTTALGGRNFYSNFTNKRKQRLRAVKVLMVVELVDSLLTRVELKSNWSVSESSILTTFHQHNHLEGR